MSRLSLLTDIRVFAKDIFEECVGPSLVTVAGGAVPAINHVELGADLVTNAARGALMIKDGEIFSRIEFPVRSTVVSIQVQNRAEVVAQDDVDIEAARDTKMAC